MSTQVNNVVVVTAVVDVSTLTEQRTNRPMNFNRTAAEDVRLRTDRRLPPFEPFVQHNYETVIKSRPIP